MKKKIGISILVIILLLAAGYFAGVGHYSNRFQANTHFGSMDISHLTLDVAQSKITNDLNEQTVKLVENGQEIGSFKLGEAGVEANTQEVLERLYLQQDPRRWPLELFHTTNYDNVLLETVQIDEEQLKASLEQIGFYDVERTPSQDASIEYAPGRGYYVEKEQQGNELDYDEVHDLILKGIQQGEDTLEISHAYQKPAITEEDESIQTVMNQIENFENTQITLQIQDHDVTIPKEEIAEFIVFDGGNQITIDQDAVQEYVRSLNDQYATFGKSRTFESTLQGTVEVPAGTLGWSIDSEEEAAQIVQDLQNGEDVTREPYIVGTGYSSDGSDIGNNYVEVDMTNQMMFVYKNGEIVVETPIVTGQPGTDTVPGAYTAWDKETPADLKGYNPHTGKDYVQPVDFWIPFDDTGQGIHDANWQSTFGGDAYTQSGSLGCINTPPGVMAEVFEQVEVGMPVIVLE